MFFSDLIRNSGNFSTCIFSFDKEFWKFFDTFFSVLIKNSGKFSTCIFSFDEWDHQFFGVSEMEAAHMDPQQRLVLECVHMALEDGGITRKHIDDTHTGVYIGT